MAFIIIKGPRDVADALTEALDLALDVDHREQVDAETTQLRIDFVRVGGDMQHDVERAWVSALRGCNEPVTLVLQRSGHDDFVLSHNVAA